MRLAPFLILLLLATQVSAAAYYTIVDDAAPASDVVNAANFAASMRASAGVTFTGKLTSEEDAAVAIRSDPVMRVVFDGQDIEIIADESEFHDEIEVARDYFREQNFHVSLFNPEDRPIRAKVEVDEPAPEPEETIVVPEVDDEVLVVEPETPPTPPPEQPEQGAFSRFWSWVRGLFG